MGVALELGATAGCNERTFTWPARFLPAGLPGRCVDQSEGGANQINVLTAAIWPGPVTDGYGDRRYLQFGAAQVWWIIW